MAKWRRSYPFVICLVVLIGLFTALISYEHRHEDLDAALIEAVDGLEDQRHLQ